jgi:hypothetical protein
VIRIRYKEFSAGTHNITGLHGVARRGARGVTVYLVPGLNVRERRAVLRRLRQEASRGFGPPLPLLALVLALCADRVRTTSGTTAALIRLHPAVTLLPGAFVAAVMTLFVLASAGRPVDFIPGPQGGGLALSQAGGVGGAVLIGRAQASPAQDRQLFVVDNLGPAQGYDGHESYGHDGHGHDGQDGYKGHDGYDGGQPLGLGKPAHGRHAHGAGARGTASGHSKAKNGHGSSGRATMATAVAAPPAVRGGRRARG